MCRNSWYRYYKKCRADGTQWVVIWEITLCETKSVDDWYLTHRLADYLHQTPQDTDIAFEWWRNIGKRFPVDRLQWSRSGLKEKSHEWNIMCQCLSVNNMNSTNSRWYIQRKMFQKYTSTTAPRSFLTVEQLHLIYYRVCNCFSPRQKTVA